MDIAIDFDGTCVTHAFPELGKDIGAAPVLKALVEKGHNLILFTMRSNFGKFPNSLDEAVQWFKDNEITLYGIQENPNQKEWTESPKCYAQLYIDDAALGCPLIYNTKISPRAFVDWDTVNEYLKHCGYLDMDPDEG